MLYSMLYNRKTYIKLMKLGYISVGMVLDYIKYTEACDMLLNEKVIIYEERISDDFNEICNT